VGIGVLEAVACAGVVGLCAAAGVIAINSPIVDRPALFVTLRSVFVPGLVAVALVAQGRGSGRRLTWLLLAVAFAFALTGLTGANAEIAFAIGRLAIPPAVVLVVYLCLAYPTGRIENPRVSILVSGVAAVVLALDVATMLLSTAPPVAGPFVRCAGAECPANPLAIVHLGDGASNALSVALALAITVMLAIAAIIVALRAVVASRLQRRSLAPLFAWTVLAAVGYGFFIAVRAINDQASLLTPASVTVAAIIAAMPLAIALGMARGRVFAMSALERMIGELDGNTGLAELQGTMSRAFADPNLRLLFWRPSLQEYVDVNGRSVELSSIGPAQQITRFGPPGEGLGAALHDPVLTEDRDVLEAAGTAIRMALNNSRLQTDLTASISELEASRKRVARAADDERRRIEQDLHDGAQQDLIALRIKLHVLEEQAAEDPQAMAPGLADAGRRVDAAIAHIRNLAHGIYPSELRDLGLPTALAAVARSSPIEVVLRADLHRRFAPEVETAVYFCCVEALQNVTKHCGVDTRVRLTLSERPDGLQFVLSDNGPGFDPALVGATHGMTGMHDRLEAIGGELAISSSAGNGTTVRGQVPVGTG
jgi:signal transduction histidine kinase